MKSTYRIIKEEYNPETFESLVEIETPIGRFIGTTVAEEADQKFPSAWQGNQIALGKAQKKFAKAAIRILKAEVAIYEKCLNCLQPEDHFWDEEGYNKLKQEYRNKLSELKIWQARLNNVNQAIILRVDTRDKLIERILKKTKDKKD